MSDPQQLDNLLPYQFLDNLDLSRQGLLPEITAEQHKLLLVAVNNTGLREYLQRTININAAQSLKAPLVVAGNSIPFLLSQAHTRGMITLAEALINMSNIPFTNEGVQNATAVKS